MLAILALGLCTFTSVAHAGDAATKSAIDEAINSHYLMMQLDQAEQALLKAADCSDCSPEVKARAWMYVGIVRGSGKSDQAGAGEAFSAAKGLDPNVQLDADLASEETKATFSSAAGSAAPSEVPPMEQPAEEPVSGAPSSAGIPPGALPPPAGVPGEMICSPQGAPIGINMSIPMSCSSETKIAEAFVKFKEPGGAEWKMLALADMDGLWQAEIPCKFTTNSGKLEFYVGAKNKAGEYVDQFGSKKDPAHVEIHPNGAAPAFPGQEPVQACAAGGTMLASDCPPDFPGCAQSQEAVCGDLDWGAACKNSSQCKCGLMCEEGACATAPTCTMDDECDTGACVDGYCSALRSSSKESSDFQRVWLSFAAGMDFLPYGGSNLCSAAEDYDVTYGIQCYDSGGDRITVDGVNIDSGLAPGQLRLKLGIDYAFTRHILVGARLGVGLINSHPRGVSDEGEKEVGYLPLHAALRGTYSITSLANAGFRPAVYLGVGFAEVNAKVATDDIRVYKVAGRIMGAVGLQAGYNFTPNVGINVDVQGMFLWGTAFSFALHPGLSFSYGF